MDEETIRAIVRDEIQHELLREGGICDHARTAAFNMVKDVVELSIRNLKDELGMVGRPN